MQNLVYRSQGLSYTLPVLLSFAMHHFTLCFKLCQPQMHCGLVWQMYCIYLQVCSQGDASLYSSGSWSFKKWQPHGDVCVESTAEHRAAAVTCQYLNIFIFMFNASLYICICTHIFHVWTVTSLYLLALIAQYIYLFELSVHYIYSPYYFRMDWHFHHPNVKLQKIFKDIHDRHEVYSPVFLQHYRQITFHLICETFTEGLQQQDLHGSLITNPNNAVNPLPFSTAP